MKALRLSIHKPSSNQSYNAQSLANLFHLSHRHKVANPRYSRSRQQVEKMDFRKANLGQFEQSGHEDPNYQNLDFTLPESQFLRDIDSELLQNTYVEYNHHWMKNFIKFTDAEFESFDTKKESSSTETSGYARMPETDSNEISQSLKYLDEWKRSLKQKRLEDDYQVKLANGSIVAYSEYLSKLNDNEKDQHYTPKQMAAIKRHNEWHKREPIHDEYGRSHGEGKRKTAKAEAMVYEGDGSIFINGKHYSQYFHNYVDRINVMIPFLVSDMDRKLNAWCKVVGGGDSGKSGAIREGIARALANYDPKLYPVLYAYRLTVRDWRKKERKKSGRPRARKSVMWKAR